MMMRAAPDAPRLVDPAMRRAVYYIAPSYQVVASANHACERSTMRCSTVAWHCSGVSVRLAGYDNIASLCVL
jgi:hypothetical protein